jgi:ribosomal protein S12 methylthiotransferase
MRRPANMDWVTGRWKNASAMPDLALRTTFIVGYPGETEAEFQTLLDFIQEVRFDKVGAFQFSFEPGTSSEPLGDPVACGSETGTLRAVDAAPARHFPGAQPGICRPNPASSGRRAGEGVAFGRSYRDAPEVDGMVMIEGKRRWEPCCL